LTAEKRVDAHKNNADLSAESTPSVVTLLFKLTLKVMEMVEPFVHDGSGLHK
jgi:hypothetical protein